MRRRFGMLVLLAVLLAVLLLARGCGGEEETYTGGDAPVGQAQEEQPQGGERESVVLGTVSEGADGALVLTLEKDGASESHTYADVKLGDWCVEALNYAVSSGWMSGSQESDGAEYFKPDYGMTRAQFATILYRVEDGEPVTPRRSYSDVAKDDWYYDCVSWVDRNGYMEPTGEDSFGAEEFISCEEMLLALHRAAGEPSSAASLEDYPYAAKVSEEALTAVRWAWEKGLIAEEECVWYPTQTVSRAQTALLLMRYNELAG